MNHKQLMKANLRTASLALNSFTPAVIFTALYVNKHLPVVVVNRDKRDNHWATEVYPIAKRTVEKLSLEMAVDKMAVLEVSRILYNSRCKYAADPATILFHILNFKMFEDELNGKGDYIYAGSHVYSMAFTLTLEIINRNRREMLDQMSLLANPKSSRQVANRMIDSIYDFIETKLEETPDDVRIKYREVVELIVKRLASLYKAVFDPEQLEFSENHLMLEDLFGDMTKRNLTSEQMTALVNGFYNKTVIEPKATEDEMKSILTGESPIAVEIDAESADDLPIADLDPLFEQVAMRIEKSEVVLTKLLTEGTTKADAVLLLGLDPYKDRKELTKYPVERNGTVHPEIVMGLFDSVRKAGRSLIRGLLRTIEKIINTALSLIGKPFNLEATVSITDKSKLAVEWGTAFPSSLDDLLEQHPLLAKQVAELPDSISATANVVQDLINSLEKVIVETNRADMDLPETFLTPSRRYIDGFVKATNEYNGAVFSSLADFRFIIGTSIPKSPYSTYGTNGNGMLTKEINTELVGSKLIKVFNTELTALKKSKVSSRQTEANRVNGLISNLLKTTDYEKMMDRVEQDLKATRAQISRTNALEIKLFEFNPEKMGNPKDLLDVQQAIREASSQTRRVATDLSRLVASSRIIIGHIAMMSHVVETAK